MFVVVIVESNAQLLNLLSISMLVVVAFTVVLNIGQNLLLTRSGQKYRPDSDSLYYRHLFTLPQTFFDAMKSRRDGFSHQRCGQDPRVS